MLKWRMLNKTSTAPLRVFLLPGKLQGEGSDSAQLTDLGSGIWRRKSHLRRKLEIHSLPVLFFLFFLVSFSTNLFLFHIQFQKSKIYMQLFCSTKYQKHSLYQLETPQPFSHLFSMFCHSQVYLACLRHIPFPNK